ncbi:hypothetical protein CYMTET_6719 [Cymbomonas tetramitiformis]|uniref:Uncharacterized protein n=1 Tax=Cymbomonas tetramitiformis TaxID=36881 RepID=A0AAE0GWW1_9CHLO|nr:hypothetical protein CYMTET_6719 [Cymbomonas tetramitiformis]
MGTGTDCFHSEPADVRGKVGGGGSRDLVEAVLGGKSVKMRAASAVKRETASSIPGRKSPHHPSGTARGGGRTCGPVGGSGIEESPKGPHVRPPPLAVPEGWCGLFLPGIEDAVSLFTADAARIFTDLPPRTASTRSREPPPPTLPLTSAGSLWKQSVG